MKVLKIKAYEFDELSDKAKEKAREWFREAGMGDDYWTEFVIDEVVEQGQFMGIEFATKEVKLMGGGTRRDPNIYWSGFWCQGDGACFEGTWRAGDVKLEKVAEGWGPDPTTTEIKRIAGEFAKVAKKYPEGYFKVVHRGQYSHKYCTEFDFEPGEIDPDHKALESYMKAEDPFDDAIQLARDRWADDFPEEDLKEAARDFMDYIYEALEREWNDRNADEQVDEAIRANDYLFTAEGKRSVGLWAEDAEED